MTSTRARFLALVVATIGVIAPGASARAGDPPAATPPAVAPPAVVDRVEAALVTERVAVAPGGDVRVGVRLRIQAGWHVYWKSPGDSGTSPTIAWTLPAGVTASPIRWPVPARLVTPPLATYVYEDDVLLPVTITVPAAYPAPTIDLVADVAWLVCEEDCEPGSARLTLSVPVRAGPAPHDLATRRWFAAADALVPAPFPAATRAGPLGPEFVALDLSAEGPWRDPAASPRLYFVDTRPYALAEEQPLVAGPGGPWLALPRSRTPGAPSARRVTGLLVGAHPVSGPFAFDVDVPIGDAPVAVDERPPRRASAASAHGEAAPPPARVAPNAPRAPSAGSPVAPSPPPAPGPDVPSAPSLGAFLLLLAGAFVGGLVLNVMPCVLPVLSVKVLSFVQQAGEDPRRVRIHGLLFALGVLLSFWAIVGLVLALRGAGHAVGWGFQFQHPVAVGVAAFLFVAMGLNLAGVYEVGARVAAAAGAAEGRVERGTVLGSIASGALATVIATPCTAPFMGPAVGYAMAAPALASFAVFTALGLGMAAPFVLLLWFPRLLAKVPRPGAWMETFRQALSFPMFAAAIAMLFVFGKIVGVVGVTWLLGACVAVALAAWLYGRFAAPARSPVVRAVVGGALPLAVVAGAVFALLVGAGKDPAADHAPPPGWQVWTPTVVDELRAQGKPVFVDFTADWCLTCKVNEATVLSTDAVDGAIARLHFAKVQADWTRPSDAIRDALAALGRASVPTYVVYPADRTRPPEVLPTTITPSQVVDALERAVAPVAAVPKETSR